MSGILDNLSLGFGVAFTGTNLLVATIGSFIGTLVGVLPGLGPVNGVAMLIPIAFAMNLPPETALILLAAVYVGAEYGGSYYGNSVERARRSQHHYDYARWLALS